VGILKKSSDAEAGRQPSGCDLTSRGSGPKATAALTASGMGRPVVKREAIPAALTTGQVPASAELKKEVILRHLADIADVRSLAVELLDEVRSMMGKTEQQLIMPARDGTKKRRRPRTDQSPQYEARGPIESKRHASSLHKLNDVLIKLQMLERKALGQSDACNDAPNVNLKANVRCVSAVVGDAVLGVDTPLKGSSE